MTSAPGTAAPTEFSFRGLTIAVTGAGRGLGKRYALDLAGLGAKVIAIGRGANVNETASEIAASGGSASAIIGAAEECGRLIEDVAGAFGGLDGLILNAGGLCDRTFARMTQDEWRSVLSGHLDDARLLLAATWRSLIARQRGRIVITTSGAGLHGNFGQANYATAKAGLIGLMKTLALEGAKHGVHCNAVAPMASSDMTKDVFSQDLASALQQDHVSPFVLAMVHPDCEENGAVIEVGGGWGAKVRWQRAWGLRLAGNALTPGMVLRRWRDVVGFDQNADFPESTQDCLSAASSTSRGVR